MNDARFSSAYYKNSLLQFGYAQFGSDLELWGNRAVSYRNQLAAQIPALTSLAEPPIIPPMPRPDAVRRVKSYSAADGFVYQYYFFEGNRAKWHGKPGGEFTYVVSADRRSTFPFKIFVMQSALDAWAELNGRALSSSEEYAVAKMRLFQAFDEGAVKPVSEGQQPGEVLVDEANLEELLRQLGI